MSYSNMLIKLVQRFYFKKKVIIGKDGFLYIRLKCPPPYIKQNCIIAGNPAKVVKTGVSWDSDGSKGYVQNGGVTAQVSKRAASLIAHANFSMPEGNFVFCLPNRILYQIWRHLDENAVEFNVKPRTFYNKIRYKLWKHFSKKMY